MNKFDLPENLKYYQCIPNDFPLLANRAYWIVVDDICLGRVWRSTRANTNARTLSTWTHSFAHRNYWRSRGFAAEDLIDTIPYLDKEIQTIREFSQLRQKSSYHSLEFRVEK